MAKITPKENFLKLRHGGMPEYVPFYSLMGDPYMGENACGSASNPFFIQDRHLNGGKDPWGVVYAAPDNLGATMPDTSIIMLEDISDWSVDSRWYGGTHAYSGDLFPYRGEWSLYWSGPHVSHSYTGSGGTGADGRDYQDIDVINLINPSGYRRDYYLRVYDWTEGKLEDITDDLVDLYE